MKGTQPAAPMEKQFNLPRTGKILIVGGRSTNFPQELRENPRLIFWDSTEPHLHSKRNIPIGVKVVITTRFLKHKHKLRYRIVSLLPKDVELIPGVFGTGELRRLLGSESSVSREPLSVKPRRQKKKKRGTVGIYQPLKHKALEPFTGEAKSVEEQGESRPLSREVHSFGELKQHLKSS